MSLQPVARPSLWSGLAADSRHFENTEEYSLWALARMEEGLESPVLATLAGMQSEDNLFVLREWLRKVVKELGLPILTGKDALLAHARGMIEETLDGQRDWCDTLYNLRDLFLNTGEPGLSPFLELQLDVSYLGDVPPFVTTITTFDEAGREFEKLCTAFIAAQPPGLPRPPLTQAADAKEHIPDPADG